MSNSDDDTLIEAIVAGVIKRLRTGSTLRRERVPRTPEPLPRTDQKNRTWPRQLTISEKIVTADLLASHAEHVLRIEFSRQAILTPSARDYLRQHQIDWSRGTFANAQAGLGVLAIIIHDAQRVARLLNEVVPGARRELLGCSDEAAHLAAGEIARGGAHTALVFSRKPHRAACLANRQPAVQAAVAASAAEVAIIRSQLDVNVWCLDANVRASFHIKSLITAAVSTAVE